MIALIKNRKVRRTAKTPTVSLSKNPVTVLCMCPGLKVKKKGTITVFVDKNGREQKLTGDEMVSMNFWGFGPCIFDYLQKQFNDFLKEHGDEQKSEFYIPTAVDNLVAAGKKCVKVLRTSDRWFGVTYKQDKQIAQARIEKLIEKGIYPRKLW